MDPLDEEQWADVEGYEDRYQVSSFGRVMAKPFLKHGRNRNGPFSFVTRRKMLSPGTTQDGYKMVVLQKSGRRKTIAVHILVAKAFLPNKSNLPQVNHKNSDRCHNSVRNLEWVTARDNVLHSYKEGKNTNAAEAHPQAILNWEKVRKIRSMYEGGSKVSWIAKEMGLDYSTVSKVVHRKNWKEPEWD